MTRHLQYAPVAFLAAGVLSGCASGGQLDPSSSVVTVTQALPPPSATSTAQDFRNYQIGPGDVVSVEVFGAPDMKRETEIDPSGNLSMPLVGTVAAGGRRPQEVAAAIANRLRDGYVVDPQVTVNVVKASVKSVTVDGAVQAPGVYPITGRMTLQQAIASAKGTHQIANLDQVVIFRTVDNRNMAALFSLKEIRTGRTADPLVYGNDIVVVGEDATRKLLRDIGSFSILGRFLPVL